MNNLKGIKKLLKDTEKELENLNKNKDIKIKDKIFINESLIYIKSFHNLEEDEFIIRKDSLNIILKKMNNFINKNKV